MSYILKSHHGVFITWLGSIMFFKTTLPFKILTTLGLIRWSHSKYLQIPYKKKKLKSINTNKNPFQNSDETNNTPPANRNQSQSTDIKLNHESHLKRLKELRKELNYLKETEWMYETVDKQQNY